MRVMGAELPEQTLIAPWMLPAEICERSRPMSFSLSTTARRRKTARSTTMAMVSMSRRRMGHIPGPPMWKASAIPLRTLIESSLMCAAGMGTLRAGFP